MATTGYRPKHSDRKDLRDRSLQPEEPVATWLKSPTEPPVPGRRSSGKTNPRPIADATLVDLDRPMSRDVAAELPATLGNPLSDQ
jgi:hypothetical protein